MGRTIRGSEGYRRRGALLGLPAFAMAAVLTVPGLATPPTDSGDAQKGRISFVINIHDWLHVDQSADILLQLVDLYEKHGIRGDFYLTAPITQLYIEKRPDLIRRLRESDMTISYHVRPPHPIYIGFSERVKKLDGEELFKTLRDYETYRLDLSAGDLLRDQPGGYRFVAKTFGRNPVALGVPARGPKLRKAARRVYRELGAKVVVEHHESGTKMEMPFEYIDGLLMRPSDFSVTRWSLSGGNRGRKGLGQFWWNMRNSPQAEAYNPTTYLEKRMKAWNDSRPPLITCIIHENNFFRQRMTPFTYVYWADNRKTRPLKPPYDSNARDGSEPRSEQNMRQIWEAYEAVVAYAAANLEVVTSEDIVEPAVGGP